MTTITKEQVVQWDELDNIGVVKDDCNGFPWQRISYTCETDLARLKVGTKVYAPGAVVKAVTLARADLEATIEELTRKYQEHAGDKYTLQDTITEQATEIERLRKVIQLAAEDIRRCDYTPARSKLLVAIAAAPKQEK